jgi:hypothetical protein
MNHHHHLQTPARFITTSNSSFLTPLPTPAPPFASSIISLSSCSLTFSSLSSAATLRRCASVIACAGVPPPPPLLLTSWPVNKPKASSSSAACAAPLSSSSRARSLSAQMATKEG